jgi:hypothetical protein
MSGPLALFDAGNDDPPQALPPFDDGGVKLTTHGQDRPSTTFENLTGNRAAGLSPCQRSNPELQLDQKRHQTFRPAHVVAILITQLGRQSVLFNIDAVCEPR